MAHTSIDCRTQLELLAIEELDKGDFLMATRILTTRIRLEPNKHELYFERSICHHKLGDYQASLDDANAAIRLNSADYNIHYQKGLALLGLSMFSEAITSFKKAIELRARQSHSKLSDIFNLLRDAMTEAKAARRRPGPPNHQTARDEPEPNQARTALPIAGGRGTNNDPVDSTTDRPLVQPGTSVSHQDITAIDGLMSNGNNNLVASNRNNQLMSNATLVFNGTIGTNRVSSSANHINNNHLMTSMNVSPDISGLNVDGQTLTSDPLRNAPDLNGESSKSSQFEWNIRRSERIFLHHTNEPGTSGPQFNMLNRHNESPGSNTNQQQPSVLQQSQRLKTGSNPSSINSGRSATKRSHDNSEVQTYHQNKTARLTHSKGSHIESDVDVDDSCGPSHQMTTAISNINDSSLDRKRVMITPSSSMPATSPGPSTSTSKDDSYSSKYKRLRRDRERARRGTSKLCTIKPADLEDLQKASESSSKKFMRVIAPIDGWLYSGQLSVDDNSDKNGPQYVVRLDGDTTRSSYLFSPETVLNDVIKEVRVKSVSELRKGARICCYWSRQYKCLSTGVVTSRTFEATKSLVSVKYDNGDLSALPLEDLRLLPPDYPKYMSNCDPLLLARSGDVNQVAAPNSDRPDHYGNSRIVVEFNPSNSVSIATNGVARVDEIDGAKKVDLSPTDKSEAIVENTAIDASNEPILSQDSTIGEVKPEVVDARQDEQETDNDDDEEATIPPTDETIDFITSETSTLKQQNENQQTSTGLVDRVSMTKDNITIANDGQFNANNSRSSSEENNYGIEYCPWLFDGKPRRSKRRHGRTYRDNYDAIRRGNEVLRVGDSAELMPRDESILPFIAKIEGFWATGRGEMRVRVRWYYRLVETEGEPSELKDGDNALFETAHFDENDVQSIYRATKILSWTEYRQNNMGHVNSNNDNSPKIFYLAGLYDPVRRIKHLRPDVRETQ